MGVRAEDNPWEGDTNMTAFAKQQNPPPPLNLAMDSSRMTGGV